MKLSRIHQRVNSLHKQRGYLLVGRGGATGGYQVQRSVRLRAAASAYFSRTPASNSGQSTWTVSFWVKRGQLGTVQNIFQPTNGGDGTNESQMRFTAADKFQIYDSGASAGYMNYVTAQVFRDPNAWYHFVIACDTTQATAADRLKIYVNGTQITAFDTAQTQNQNLGTGWNGAQVHTIGKYPKASSGYADLYLAEFNNVSGQALTPSAFGEQDTATRMWVPKRYTGTYGTNGFYLDFSDITSTTTLGYDKSGNGNNWTANNFSLTAGVTYDSMLDVPGLPWADGGNGRGNYCVLNPLDRSNSTVSIADGNLTATGYYSAGGNILFTAGKWYCEATALDVSTSLAVGVLPITPAYNSGGGGPTGSVFYFNDGTKSISGASTSYGATYTVNDIIGVAVDADAGTMTFYKNGVSQGAISFSVSSGGILFAHRGGNAATKVAFNFGQRPFAYTQPTGFKALHTGNLPTPTGAAAKPWEHFDVLTWSGSGGASRSITGANFQPDFAWGKVRNNTYRHNLFDVVRGVGSNKDLCSNQTVAEGGGISSQYGYISAFTAGGFTVTAGSDATIPNAYWNQSSNTYAAWLWKAGGAAVSNTAGSITSQVSANTVAGFSIVTYAGTGASATIGHGLGVAPKLIIVKSRSAGGTSNWAVYHASNSATGTVWLNVTNPFQTTALPWNNTAPTSSVFSIGTTNDDTNTNARDYVAYCFAEVPGFSKMGSYTGNGSADGPFVYCGLRPKYVMVKRTDSTGDWVILDAARSPENVVDDYLLANSANTEVAATIADFTANGFKLRLSTSPNVSGGTYIYVAFAESPFQYANAR